MRKKFLWAWDLLTYHATCALRAEFNRYHLHFLWWFLEPVMFLGTLYLVFGIFRQSTIPNYALFLLTGLVVWQWFAKAVAHATNSIYQSMRSFQQHKVSPFHFPLCVFMQDSIKTLPVFAVFFLVFAFLAPMGPSLVWFNLIPILLVEAICIIGCSLFVAAIVPFLPDLSMLVPIMTRMMFFAAGIFYNIDDVVLPDHRMILYSNPVTVCIKEMRGVLIYSQSPDWALLGYGLMVSLFFLGLGCAMIQFCRAKYPRIINQ